MIVKFCCENEIHRCSDPPADFSSLPNFLSSMFRIPLPSQIDLYYTTPEGQTAFLNTEEDYQKLVKNQSNKPYKITIIEKKSHTIEEKIDPSKGVEDDRADYEVIPHYQEEKIEEIMQERSPSDIIEVLEEKEPKKESVQEEEEEEQILLNSQDEGRDELNGILDKMTDNITHKYVMPQVQYETESIHIKRLVKDALREEMPFIISQIKEAILKDSQLNVPNRPSTPEQSPKINSSYQAYCSYPYYQQPITRVNNYPGQIPQIQAPRSEENNFGGLYQAYPQPHFQANGEIRPTYAQRNSKKENQPQLLNKVMTALSRPINKASELVDNFVQQFEGDPYVYCAEGKYNKSVVDKVAYLKEMLPEEDKKELLEFVQRFPRDVPLDQLAEVYWSKKKMT